MFFSRRRAPAAAVTTLAPRIPEGLRVYATGDIHGRADLLGTILESIDADRDGFVDARLVFLGDYVDRGIGSREVIERLRIGVAERGWACLLGNHEAMMLDALDGRADMELWLANGGIETLFSYGVHARESLRAGGVEALREKAAAAVPETHLAFLRSLSLSVTFGDYFFCHAGVRPGVPLDRQAREDLIWIRQEFIGSSAYHGKRVVHGHTPAMEPELLPNRINIDTGAYLTNHLSCVVLEADSVRIIQT